MKINYGDKLNIKWELIPGDGPLIPVTVIKVNAISNTALVVLLTDISKTFRRGDIIRVDFSMFEV